MAKIDDFFFNCQKKKLGNSPFLWKKNQLLVKKSPKMSTFVPLNYYYYMLHYD